jgi:hypothetical protein
MSTNEIATYTEKVHENFPGIPVDEMVKICCEQQAIPYSETEFFNTNLTNIPTSAIIKFILKVHKKFPENPLMGLFKIWTVEEYKPRNTSLKPVNIYIYIYIYIYKRPESQCTVYNQSKKLRGLF